MYDVLVIGSGLSGLISAFKKSKEGKRVLIIEKRSTIGGNVYDKPSYNGILEQVYGPHILHTNKKEVIDFLSNFTEFFEYEHKVAINLNGELISMPFNINSLYEVFPRTMASRIEEKLLSKYEYGSKVPILKLKEENDSDLSFLYDFIYNNVFLGYTMKQWGGLRPEDLDAQVTSRVPISISRDNRYFADKYQMQPKHGFTRVCENVLADMKNTAIMFNTDFREIVRFDEKNSKVYLDNTIFNGEIIYTACIEDILSENIVLPYRSLRFDKEIIPDINSYQKYSVINYSNTQNYTRVTEFKKLTGQENINGTVVIKEYSVDYNKNAGDYSSIPYYPIPIASNFNSYEDIKSRVNSLFPQVKLLGRLAEYKYYNIDDAINNALLS